MEEKFCRICAKQHERYTNISAVQGLKTKIETCLPIIITPDYPLQDTICTSCVHSIDNYFNFVTACVESIESLEQQFVIIESCLKSKRLQEKSTYVDSTELFECLNFDFDYKTDAACYVPNLSASLVDYECSSDSNDEEPLLHHEEEFLMRFKAKTEGGDCDSANDIINEIVQRKCLKRKSVDVLSSVPKVPKVEFESSSRRKNRQPKKVEYRFLRKSYLKSPTTQSELNSDSEEDEKPLQPASPDPAPLEDSETAILQPEYPPPEPPADYTIPEKLLNLPSEISVTREIPEAAQSQEALQTCLLCERQFYGALLLASHMFDVHGIDLAQVYANSEGGKPVVKNRKIPNLVKISDVFGVRKQKSVDSSDDPPVLEPQERPASPPSVSISAKTHYTCSECQGGAQGSSPVSYTTFKDYSSHRRSAHQIFHCDLCPKFYGRNSHLWKHVNRVHKGHPSITCQQCYKTSASKYHLSQHFNKMHSTKSQKPKVKSSPTPDDEEFMTQKFQGFDFQSVRQSFLKQEMIDKQKVKKATDSEDEMPTLQKARCQIKDLSDPPGYASDSESNDALFKLKEEAPKLEVQQLDVKAPKEIDSTSDLYTNIITNYTPPTNEGPYKCPKCFKGFHKKNLLKKHKKNCRPRLQKDLLTRCKTCSRIFKDRQSLAKHLINYHSEYTCEICNLAVQSKCEIVSHIRFSHPNSELTCYCGQILRTKADLLKHTSDHRDTHVCQFCGDMLPTKIKLKMHILSLHRKILSLSCGICLKLFETQHILKDHVRLVHRDQLTPLTSCTVCGKNYGSKWKTYDHLNKSHGRIFRACKTCLEVFETEDDLQKHFDEEHLTKSEKKSLVKVEEKEFEGLETNQNSQEYIQDEHTTSETEDEDTNEANMQNMKSLQDDVDYRNYVIREFNQTFDKKAEGHNGLGAKEKSKNQENKISLLEKRLLGKKLLEGEVKISHKAKKKKILENGGRHFHRKKSDEYRSDMENVYGPNPSKRTVYVNSNDPSLCEICLKVWPAKKHLWQHYIRCHKQVAATVCGICLRTNPSYSSLQTHLREMHPNLLHGCGFGSNFICKICGRYHNASSKLRLHMAIHVGYNDFNPTDMKCEEEKNELTSDSDTEKADEKSPEGGINYESLIEEVEASSDSDDGNQSDTPKGSDHENSSSDCDSDSSDDFIENDLEQEMLKNMIGENSMIKHEDNDMEEDDGVDLEDQIILEPQDIGEQVEIIDQDNMDDDLEYGVKIEDEDDDANDSSDVSEDGSYKSYNNIKQESVESNYNLDGCKVKMEMCSSDEWTNSPQVENEKTTDSLEENLQKLFQTKADELDSAIRSISYECDNEINSEFTDLQNLQNTLTESELETAVGSIL